MHGINALACERLDSRVDLSHVSNRRLNQHKPASPRDLFRLFDAPHRNRFVGIEHHSYSDRRRQRVFEKFDALTGQSSGTLHHRHAGDVSAWPREAGNEALAYRVTRQGNNRDLVGRILDHGGHRRSYRDQHVRPQLHQLGRKTGEAVVMALAEAVINDDVLSVYVPELLHSLSEALLWDSGRISRRQPPDPRQLPRRLGAAALREGKERRPRHAERRKLAPPHSITSSARPRIDGGIVRPSALAVLRLMTSSNRVGCWIGRSAGLAPARTRPA